MHRMTRHKILLLLMIVLFLGWVGYIWYRNNIKHNNTSPQSSETVVTQNIPISVQNEPYTIKSFDLIGRLRGLSSKQINEHETLYHGYVNKRNEIARRLKTANRAETSKTYSPFRELKVEETYAVNGSLLHELYFENMGKPGSTIGPQMKELIKNSYGTLAAFKNDFLATAKCARGWTIASYGLDDGKLHIYLLEEHNQNVPILALPLLVLDMYEHAYMIDFGIKKDPYLAVFWENIDWNAVEDRINKWVNPLRNSNNEIA